MRGRVITWVLLCAMLALPASAAAAPGWTPAETLPTTGSSPTIGTADDGTTLLAWITTASAIQTAIRPAGGALTATSTLACRTGDTCSTPQLAINRRGDAVLAWEVSDGTSHWLDGAFRPAGGTWSDPAPVTSDVEAQVLEPRVAITPTGEAFAIWRHKTTSFVIIRAARRPFGGSWLTAENISNKASDWPSIAVDGSGNATIAWMEGGAVNDATRPAGGQWALDPAPPAATNATRPEVAMAADGRTLFAWPQMPDFTVRASVRAPGGSWATPVTVGPESSYGDPIDIAFDSASGATVLFVQGPTGGNAIGGSWLGAGAPQWTQVLNMQLGGFADTYAPHVAGGAAGQTVGAWYGAASPNHVQATTRTSGANWGVTQDLGPGGAPDDAVDGEGNAVIAWGSSNTIYLTAHDIAPPDIASFSTPAAPVAGQAAAFALSARDRWSATGPVSWDFGDGATGSGATITHTYAAPGTYTVRAAVADALDNGTTVQRAVAVSAPATPTPTPTPSAPAPTPTPVAAVATPAPKDLTIIPGTPLKEPSRKVAVRVSNGFNVPAGASVKLSCATSVSLTLKLGKHVLATGSAALKSSGRTCRFTKSFSIARSKVGSAKTLKCVVRYRATKALAGRSWSIHVSVGA